MFRLPTNKRDRDETSSVNNLPGETGSPMLRQKSDHTAREVQKPTPIQAAMPLFQLPPEIFLNIVRKFSPHEPVRQVSRSFYHFFHDNQAWHDRLKKHFPAYLKTLPKNIPVNFRTHYQIAHHEHYFRIPKSMIIPLYFAREGNAEKLFISHDGEYTLSIYDLAVMRDTKYSIFQILSMHGHQSILDLIYAKSKTEKRPAVVLTLGNIVFTKIHWAIACKQPIEVIQEVVEQHGEEVNFRNCDGSTPLGLAMELDDIPAFKAVLASPVLNHYESVSKKQNALTFAASKGNEEMTNAILALHINPNTKSENGLTPLATAALHGHLAVTQILLNPPIPFQIIIDSLSCDMTQQKYYTALHFAAMHGHLDIVTTLLRQGADANHQVEHFLEHGLMTVGTTALHLATANSHWLVAECLLNIPDIEINNLDLNGCSPLHYAMAANHEKMVVALLEKNAQLLLNEENIEIVIGFASRFGYSNIAKQCLTFDASIKTRVIRDTEMLPNEIARMMGHHDLADLLTPMTPRMGFK